MTDRDKGLCCAIKASCYAKEHAIARGFHKAFRLIENCLLLGLMVAISLEAQQSVPSAPAWTGVVELHLKGIFRTFGPGRRRKIRFKCSSNWFSGFQVHGIYIERGSSGI